MKYVTLALLLFPLFAQAGRESGGGNQCKLMLRAKLNELTSSGTEITALVHAGVYLDSLKQTADGAKLEVASELKLNGKKVDAINDPAAKSITLDEDRCLAIATNNEAFTSLLVHELLGLKRIDDKNYQISNAVYQELLHRIPVMSPYQEPRYWMNLEGVNFTKDRFDIMVHGRSGKQFAEDVIAANGGGQTFDIFTGTILIKNDAYYVTYDSFGEVVSVMIEGEEDGKMPAYSTGRETDDWLCFFKGLRAGTCSRGDDS